MPEHNLADPILTLPERMRANKLLAGRLCGHCGAVVELGDSVFNCASCGATEHAPCRELACRCANPKCPTHTAAAPTLPMIPIADATTKPCLFCGETIESQALKCQFCGEYQDGRARGKESEGLNAPLFLYVPVSRMIFLSIISVHLYEVYWMYKTWSYIKKEALGSYLRGIRVVFVIR